MDNVWLASALWVGLALVSSLISIRVAISVALIEIVVGSIAGNWLGLAPNPWVNYLAGVGSVLLTFLAGAEIDPVVIRKHFWASVLIGSAGFFVPFFGVLAYTRFVSGWSWPQAEIAGLALSTTSVAVVYAVMVETGYNRHEVGKIILAACFHQRPWDGSGTWRSIRELQRVAGGFRRGDGSGHVGYAQIRSVVLQQGWQPHQRAGDQVHSACAVPTGRVEQHGKE